MGYILCKKYNGIILKDTTIKDLRDYIILLNESMIFNNEDVSPFIIYTTYDHELFVLC